VHKSYYAKTVSRKVERQIRTLFEAEITFTDKIQNINY